MSSESAPIERTETCQRLVEDFLKGEMPPDTLWNELRETGITSKEADSWIEMMKSRLDARNAVSKLLHDNRLGNEQHVPQTAPPAPSGSRSGVGTVPSSDLAADLLNLTYQSTSSHALSPNLLSAAPHLAELRNTAENSHLHETWRLRRAFIGEKSLDGIVDLMQQQYLEDPIPRSLWRDIIRDRFVDFEKLYASMDVGYDHRDEPTDFVDDYAIVKKDEAIAKRAVETESDWSRVFRAWMDGVCLLYPHRLSELRDYRKIVMDLFRALPGQPDVAIRFDFHARDSYAKHPFRMDDRAQLNIPLLSQLLLVPDSSEQSGSDNASSSSSSSSIPFESQPPTPEPDTTADPY
jgi:hypothetical protein